MKLPAEITLEPGFYLVTFMNSQATIIQDPEYDGGLDLLTGKKVAVDGVDDNGTPIYIDMLDVRLLEVINAARLTNAITMSSDKSLAQRVLGKIELMTTMNEGSKLGIVQGGQNTPQEMHPRAGPHDVPPPAR